MVTAIEGPGTSESVWLPFLDSLRLPGLDLSSPPRRVVVVAPHPDDEVLAVGGLIALLAGAGAAVEVVAVTDGEASNPGGSIPAAMLAGMRAAETEAALQALGVAAPVHRLGLPDGAGQALEQSVVDAVQVDGRTWLLAPWHRDGHPDHEAAGRACARVAERDGARLLAYPVWLWHWAAPADPVTPWERARTVRLPPPVQEAKARAVDAFATQTQPIGPLAADAPVLPPYVLARFARPYEVVLT